MYYQNYEDYMRQILGYPINDSRIYENYDYRNNQPTYENTYSSRNQYAQDLSDEEINEYYPEIYKSVYPMVCKVCEANTKPITKELLEKMTDEIYFAIEGTNNIVNIRVESPKPENNRSSSSVSNKSSSNVIRTQNTDTRSQKMLSKEENRQVNQVKENRQYNSTLRDLIKILILKRLFEDRPNRPKPPRPPFIGEPGIPPYPGTRPPVGPGGPNRPPIQPRDYNGYLNF